MNDQVELIVPPEDVVTLDINGYKFFRGRESNTFQCATCLNVMGILPVDVAGYNRGEVRTLKIVKDCECPRQNE